MKSEKHVDYSTDHLDGSEIWAVTSGGCKGRAVVMGETVTLTQQIPIMEGDVFPSNSITLPSFPSSKFKVGIEVETGDFTDLWPTGPPLT